VLLRPSTAYVYKREKVHAKAAGLMVVEARTDKNLEKAFASAVKQGAGALIVCADPHFTTHRKKLVALAAKYKMPTAYPWREYVEEGGLMSFGPSLTDAYRQVGLYAGKILDGHKPHKLPVHMKKISDFETVINAKTAKKLGLQVSQKLRALGEVV
jgi:putative ABC transport system substrate-binding protein